MIPLRSLLKLDRFPYLNYFFIILNIAIFVYFYNVSSLFFLDYGVTPSKLGMPNSIIPFYEKIYPFVTYMFLHGNIFHLLFNILFLYIYGGAVENKLGHGLYFFFYIILGIIAAIVQVFMSPSSSSMPIIGASGAIAGLMGAYIVYYPLARIRTLIIVILADVYAFVIIGIWFAIQIMHAHYGWLGGSNVAFWAHIGGFIAGFVFALLGRIKSSLSK